MPKKAEHYVDNLAFLAALKAYKAACKRAKRLKQEEPPIPEFVGECFLKIANHLSYRPNFANYSFREDMVADGVENCCLYCKNFDPAKSNNPFGYFTTTIFFAFVRRIQREKKITYTKYKLIEQMEIDGTLSHQPEDGGSSRHRETGILKFENVQDFITKYDAHTDAVRTRRKRVSTSKEKK